MKSRLFNWVSLFLNDDLRAKRFEGARKLLDVLKSQEKGHFRDLVTRDETWVSLDMRPRTVWLSAETELSVCAKRTIASGKRMLIVFWGVQGIVHCCWFLKDSTLDSTFFCEEILDPIAQKLQPNPKKTRKPLILIDMDNAAVHTVKVTQEKRDVSQ
jgi:hypothetical protein